VLFWQQHHAGAVLADKTETSLDQFIAILKKKF
jgi:hypothetical protein